MKGFQYLGGDLSLPEGFQALSLTSLREAAALRLNPENSSPSRGKLFAFRPAAPRKTGSLPDPARTHAPRPGHRATTDPQTSHRRLNGITNRATRQSGTSPVTP